LVISAENLLKAGVKPEAYLKKIESTPKASAWKFRLDNYSPNSIAVQGLSRVKKKFSLVSFSAHWCKDCVQNIPALVNSLRSAKNANIQLVMIDVDDNKKTAQEADVRAIPTIIIYNAEGNEVARIIENPSKEFGSIEEELLSILTRANN
jgi:thiol-disulfide isomerase/thioredoxin